MEVTYRLKSWIAWVGTFATAVLGWLSFKNDSELPKFVLKYKKEILFVLGIFSVFATFNNPTNPNGF